MMIIPYDSTLSAQGQTVSKLISTLELESNIAIDWEKIHSYLQCLDY